MQGLALLDQVKRKHLCIVVQPSLCVWCTQVLALLDYVNGTQVLQTLTLRFMHTVAGAAGTGRRFYTVLQTRTLRLVHTGAGATGAGEAGGCGPGGAAADWPAGVCVGGRDCRATRLRPRGQPRPAPRLARRVGGDVGGCGCDPAGWICVSCWFLVMRRWSLCSVSCFGGTERFWSLQSFFFGELQCWRLMVRRFCRITNLCGYIALVRL